MMSRFKYTAVDAAGTMVKDELDAMSEAFARVASAHTAIRAPRLITASSRTPLLLNDAP